MKDIQSKVLSKYGIDISRENILKLYKIDHADLSVQELEEKIRDTRKRWNASINGANEKTAERDQARLEKADKFEAILKDAELRKELFHYYRNSGEETEGTSTDFAREYFALVGTSKKIRKADVEFFFNYYPSERKNRKAILEMLKKELKVFDPGKEEKYAKANDLTDEEGEEEDISGPLIVNLFRESTVLKIRKAIDKHEEAKKVDEICQRYPEIQKSLYEFLDINDVSTAEQLSEKMDAKGKEAFALRQEKGTAYVPLVDLFNILKSLCGDQDVADNIPAFKLLLKYPKLTPYMFAFVEMKPKTLKAFAEVASHYYGFRDDADFILNYYNPVHDHFGISDHGIASLLRKAEKKAAQNKVLNTIDEKLGRTKDRRRLPFGAELGHWLAYWPISLAYFVFEVIKGISKGLRFLEIFVAIGVGILASVLLNFQLPKLGIHNLLDIAKIIGTNQWVSYLNSLEDLWGGNYGNIALMFIESIIIIAFFAVVYVCVPSVAGVFVYDFAYDLNKRFDWIGIERTFQRIFQTLKQRTEDQYFEKKKAFYKKIIGNVITNAVCIALLCLIIWFLPTGAGFVKEKGADAIESIQEQIAADDVDEKETEGANVQDTQEVESMVITVGTAKIRSGPGTDYDVLRTANQGETFIATGNQETASNGRIWYEIYLDEGMTQTGWASEKVIA